MTTSAPQIVVGVDGSIGARLALDWALDEADAKDLPLTVVSSWHPLHAGYGYGAAAVTADVGAGAERAAQPHCPVTVVRGDHKDTP